NGGIFAVAAVGMLLSSSQGWLALAVGSLCASEADTWATEVGTAFGRAPRLILTGRVVPTGTSGAMSAAGTFAAVGGARFVALAVARAGVDVTVVDRARFPRPKPCAEYLSPEASRILADMGALDRVERSGAAALAGIHVRAPNGAVIRGDFIASHGFRGFRD